MGRLRVYQVAPCPASGPWYARQMEAARPRRLSIWALPGIFLCAVALTVGAQQVAEHVHLDLVPWVDFYKVAATTIGGLTVTLIVASWQGGKIAKSAKGGSEGAAANTVALARLDKRFAALEGKLEGLGRISKLEGKLDLLLTHFEPKPS